MALPSLPVLPQYLIPQHGLSRLVGTLINSRQEKFKNWIIDWFIKKYRVEMQDAVENDPHRYPDFNSFFTRHLRPETRPIIAGKNTIACPTDGTLSEFGAIQEASLLQAKQHRYSLIELLGGSTERANSFINGAFATLYLAPKDYHRVHIPLSGKLREMIHVPGKLFSVNLKTANDVPNLFARNERVICLFETATGPMAVILVGAMIVASIATTWAGLITPTQNSQIRTWQYPDNNGTIYLTKGDELGHFQLGSTVIILFGPEMISWDANLRSEQTVKMGQLLGVVNG
jgi:phosphatidylserine decarboxylase